MKKEACFRLGHVVRPHGLDGELQVILDVDDLSPYQELESVFVEQRGQLIPFFIEGLRMRANRTLVAFEGIETVEEADKLRNAELYLPLEALPELEADDQFYYHEIIGFSVQDESLGSIGTVNGVYEGSGQDLLAIDHEGREILIPVVEPIVNRVKRDEKVLFVNLPEGLLEL